VELVSATHPPRRSSGRGSRRHRRLIPRQVLGSLEEGWSMEVLGVAAGRARVAAVVRARRPDLAGARTRWVRS
jgi:hypothetical protein